MNDQIDSIICLRPFYSLELNIRGDVSTCCPAWAKGMVGNTKRKSLPEIWNDAPLQNMRQMMLEGRWEKICRPSCPVIISYRMNNRKIPLDHPDSHVITEDILSAVRSRKTALGSGPTMVNMANSTACNLNCIMCGREHHKDNTDAIAKTKTEVNSMLPDLRELFLAGNGDPFARPDTRDLMLNLDSAMFPDLRINLLTNGLLLPKYWERIQHLNFGYLNVSIDAATERTYERVRRGGRWQELLQALEIARGAKDRFSFIMLNMTVMRENYREIPAFIELASRYGFKAGINRIRGKWGDQNFFTSGEGKVLDELKRLISEARGLAEALQVDFDSTSFEDIMSNRRLTPLARYRQQAVDLMRAVYYRLK